MTKNGASKELKSGRPFIITISCLIILFVYLILPSLTGSFIYVKFDNPEIKRATDLFYGLAQANLPQNYYLKMGLLIFTLLSALLLPYLIFYRYWNMKKKGVASARNLCLLNLILFYLHFSLIDEALDIYPYLGYLLTSLLFINIILFIAGFLYKRRMV